MSEPFDLARIGEGLAFAHHLGELHAHLPAGACVVQAPPGSGKTTLVPPAVANHLAATSTPRVLVTAPRRIAVRAAAGRLSHLDSSDVGEQVGYTIRGERARSTHTLIEFLTPGVLLRRLIAEPDLVGIGGVILDEVHERSVETDLLLGMLTELRVLRDDLILVAMSATVEAEKFAALLGEVPVLKSAGEQHPVSVNYAPFPGARFTERGISTQFLDHVAATASRATKGADDDSDTLVFLPGRHEITYVSRKLSQAHPGLEVLPLFSGAPTHIQRAVLTGRNPGEARRIVVATDVAESSLTVPGVHTVVDSCLTREARRDARRGMSGLVTITASHAASQQRAGRAGRLGPGRAFRCIDEATYASAPATPTPQVATADLTFVALVLACWGTPGGEGISLPDPLPSAALEQAHAELRRLGAIDDNNRPTALGHQLVRLPVDPNLGHALIRGNAEVGARTAAEIVALLALDTHPERADLPRLWRELRDGSHPDARRWRTEVDRLRRLLTPSKASGTIPADEQLGYVAGLGPGRIARLDEGSYLLTSGTRASLPEGSPLAGHEWLVITDAARSKSQVAAQTGAIVHSAAPISRARVELITPPATMRHVDVANGRVFAREQRTFGKIVHSSTPVRTTGEENAAALTEYIHTRGLSALEWSTAARHLRGRVAILRAHLGEAWPDVSDEALGQHLDWIAPYITEPEVKKIPVHEALQAVVGRRMGELNRLAPKGVRVPSGRTVPLEYPFPSDGVARASVKLQECFGLRTSPTILDGRLPVTFELLSPANRPLAVTSDLEFFWAEVYPQVRAENRARYAKHPWPQDPWSHEATSATNRQLQRRR